MNRASCQEKAPLQHTGTHWNTLEHTGTHCNTLQHTATHCNTLQPTATHCKTLHHTAQHCTTLQHTVTYCNTLQIGALQSAPVVWIWCFLHRSAMIYYRNPTPKQTPSATSVVRGVQWALLKQVRATVSAWGFCNRSMQIRTRNNKHTQQVQIGALPCRLALLLVLHWLLSNATNTL